MRIGILGLGGVGGFIGAPLANYYKESKDVEIIFICRGQILSNIKANGLSLKSPNGTIKVNPHLTTDNSQEIGILDVLIVTVKSYSLQGVIKEYEQCISDNTIIITIQNIVNAEEEIRQVLSEKGDILEGSIYVASNVIEPGSIHHKGGPGKILFGGGKKQDYQNLVDILKEGGLDVTYQDNIKKVLWSKYIFVSPVAAVTAAYNVTFGKIIEDLSLKKETIALMEEVKALADKNNISLEEDIISTSFDLLHKFPFEAKSSLQLDYESGKNTEREFLVDYVYHQSKLFHLNAEGYKSVMSLLSKK